MNDILSEVNSSLFAGISSDERKAMLGCIGYHISTFRKGDIIAFEEENIKHIGIVLSGSVDMVKEDLWGNKTMLVRIRKDEVFGETFACGSDSASMVTFLVSEDTAVLFLPFNRVMHSCTMACRFHHRLIENKNGNELPIRGSNGGSSSGRYMDFSVYLVDTLDINSIAKVQCGDITFK